MRKIARARSVVIVAAFAALIAARAGGVENAMSSADSNNRNAEVLRDVLKKMGSGQKVERAEFQEFVKAQNDGLATGPAIGEPVPDFTLPDENGKEWTLAGLMGPKGLLLVFSRSADW